ncbi:MAG: DUF6651 domain-containing protein [Candidatus Thorarchaeota archaeon]
MSWKIEDFKYMDGEEEKTLQIIATNKSGDPIWVHEKDGVEAPIDAKHYFNKIPELLEEKRQLKEAKKQLEGEFNEHRSKYEDIEDPQAALKALEIVANLDSKKLIDAKKVDQLRNQMKEDFDKAMEKERTVHKDEVDSLKAQLEDQKKTNYGLTVSNSFKSSKLLAGPDAIVGVPVDMIEDKWGKNFSTEIVDGKPVTVGHYDDGRPILSDVKPGEFASFDEALKKLIDVYPNKAGILKGKQQSGGGVGVGNANKEVKSEAVKDLSSYTHISDFKTPAEKQAFIDKYGLEKWRVILKNSRGTSNVGRVNDMGSVNR